jgi:hypothetical protein
MLSIMRSVLARRLRRSASIIREELLVSHCCQVRRSVGEGENGRDVSRCYDEARMCVSETANGAKAIAHVLRAVLRNMRFGKHE